MSNITTPRIARRRRGQRASSPLQTQTTAGHFLAATGLKKNYHKANLTIPVLKGATLAVKQGEFCAIMGQSGSGKSTLLHVLATLDAPDEGQIYYEANRIDGLSSRGRDVLRNRHFGMIFQFYHLLPELTTLENVLLPAMVTHSPWKYFAKRRQLRERANQLLELTGLSHRLRHKPRELSGGEMQRVAIARALISQPRLLFADEPTGNLDQKTGGEIMDVLRRLMLQNNLTIVMVTHDPTVAAHADRTLRLVEGRVEND